jgi:hypothetical protein
MTQRCQRLKGRPTEAADAGLQLFSTRDGNWTRGYGYPRVSYPVDMDTGLKSYSWILSGRVPEIRRVGYE